jgi:hypothetical protein
VVTHVAAALASTSLSDRGESPDPVKAPVRRIGAFVVVWRIPRLVNVVALPAVLVDPSA